MFRTRRTTLVAIILALLIEAVPVFHVQPVQAAPGLPNRSLTLDTNRAGDQASYQFRFDLSFNGTLGSMRFEFCNEDPNPFLPCTAPFGFDVDNAPFGPGDQTGETGFTVHGSSTDNEMVLTRTPAVLTPQTVSYTFNPTDNPAFVGSYFVRIYTYATDDGTGPSNEEAGIVFAIEDGLDISAFVPPFLEFCVAISIPGANCATSSGVFVDMGDLSETATRTATSQFAGATNGNGGLAVTVIGTTMTSGTNTIAEMSPGETSSTGTSQFGMNLRNNSSPNVGVDPIGTGSVVPTANYNQVNRFTYSDGAVVASSPISTDYTRGTASYIVNVDSDQRPGTYTTTLTYVGTATF